MSTAEPVRTDGHSTRQGTQATQTTQATASRSGGDPERPGGTGVLADLWDRLTRRPVLVTTVLAATVHLLWFLFFANSGGDLAAQDAWTEFVGRHPDSAYNLAWYGGMHPVSYSVVSPYLMSLIGVRPTMMVAGTVSAALTALILVRVRAVRNPLVCSLAGVFAFLCNALSGRVTFGLGMMFALGAVAAVFCWPHRWRYKRWAKAATAAPLAALATASSPVAGLFLGVIAAALFLNKRRPGAYAIGLAPVAVVALSSWLFPFSGTQPMSLGSTSLPFVYGVAVFLLVPKEWRTVRVAAAVYSIGTLLTWAIDSQIGSNISRLPMLFAGVVLLAALPYTVPRSRKWYALAVAFIGLNAWIGFKAVDDLVRTAPTASWNFELAPLINKLQEVKAERGRVEVVPASSHREASALAPYVNLARGWNRQADMKRNPIFYDEDTPLTSADYRAWLERWAVHYVVLPKGSPDSSAKQEAELVRGGLPYLERIWGDENWQLFAVRNPVPLAEPSAVVREAGADEVRIRLTEPGRVLIRVPYSPWLSLVDENGDKVAGPQETAESKRRPEGVPKTFDNTEGCLIKAEENAEGDEWTELVAPRAGEYRLSAPYDFPRGTPCPEELH
ncbi:MFS transporter [Streptomyces katsurahamanus]|uniref:MFS transporter n=1 Tax=Streptomyces katsurahamanus TaxID=2577098 RepID=A0ABW9NMX2_9ACTN|nr:MFS transporter [Streptomyces katsurahamanus]